MTEVPFFGLLKLGDIDNLEKSNSLFSTPVHFIKSVTSSPNFPTDELPEVCFAGRSNVGKSSLLNALTNRKTLARTSNTPGRTQQINFFSIGKKMYLVDLPGYGYAKAPLSEVKKWNSLAYKYMSERRNLKRIFLLIDIRHGPNKKDYDMMSLLDRAAVSYQIIFTKSDKLKPCEIETLVNKYSTYLEKQIALYPKLIISSAETKLGMTIIRSEIAKFY